MTMNAEQAEAELRTIVFNPDDVDDLMTAARGFKWDTDTIYSIIDPDSDHGRNVLELLAIIDPDS